MAELPKVMKTKLNHLNIKQLLISQVKCHKTLLLGFLFLTTFHFPLPTSLYSAGTTGAEFLTMGSGARPGAMGQAFSAVANDINTIFWNPAGLSQLNQSQLSFMHNEGLVNTQYEFFGFAHPTNSGTFAASIAYLHQGDIVSRNTNGYNTGDFTAYDSAITFSYGSEISQTLSFGFNIKMIKQQIADISASGMAVDFGTLYHTPVDNLSMSATLQNAGPGITFVKEKTPLPTKLSFGCAYNMKGLILAADFNMPKDDKAYFNIGTECPVSKVFAIRSGLISQKDLAVPTALSYGFGLQYTNYGLDYAFLPFGELGDTHRVSATFKFGRMR